MGQGKHVKNAVRWQLTRADRSPRLGPRKTREKNSLYKSITIRARRKPAPLVAALPTLVRMQTRTLARGFRGPFLRA